MKEYHDLLEDILKNGTTRDDRTGTGTLSVFGRQLRFDLSKGFPAITTKKLAWKACVSELLWFLEGSTDERRLAEILYGKSREELIGKTTIWTANGDNQGKSLGYENNDLVKQLGPVYGYQFRRWGGKNGEIDQIKTLVSSIKNDPYSRRHILSAWNVSELSEMALPPCHMFSQFYVSNDKLSCQMYMRSADVALGVPFNIASYSLLTHMLAQVCGLKVGDFVLSIGDAHIYSNHVDGVKEQLSRDHYPSPSLWLNPDINDIDDFKMEDIKLVDYQSHGTIRLDMAV